MSLKKLEDFLNEKSGTAQPDWEEIKRVWLASVDQFYQEIQSILSPLQAKGLLQFELEQVSLEEEHLGVYQAPKMTIKFKDQTAFFQPIGRLILGALGRIDLYGPMGKVTFLWVKKDSEEPKATEAEDMAEQNLEWKIATPPPKITFLPINDDSFSDCLLNVLNG